MSNEQLSSEEISRRITTGMGLVYDLFKEMHSLFRLISQGLENSAADVQPQGPKGYILPRGKKGTTVADRFIKTDMGLLVAIGLAAIDEPDDESEEIPDEDDQEAEKDTATVEITPDTSYLGIRAILFDPQASNPAMFQPTLIAGIISSMTKEPRGAKKAAGVKQPETSFTIRRNAVKMLVKLLPADAKTGTRILARVRGASLNAQLSAVHSIPLADISTEERVNEYVDRLIKLIDE